MTMESILDWLRTRASWLVFIVLPAFSGVMHLRAFRQDLISVHAWRQTQTQSTIVNFAEEDFNILHPRRNDRGSGDGIFRMEFPLMQWLFAAFYKVFGNHLILSRLLSFVIGLGSLFGMYHWLRHFFKDDLAGLLGAWTLQFSPAFFYYSVNPLPDNLALCFGIWGLSFSYRWYTGTGGRSFVFAAIFLGLASLVKLPFVLLWAPGVWLLLQKSQWSKLGVVAISLLPSAAWYGSVIGTWQGNGIVGGMLSNTTDWRILLGYLWDILVSMLPETLLNYGSAPLLLVGCWFCVRQGHFRDLRFPSLAVGGIAVGAYILFELNMITNVHDYYLFPLFPFLFLTVAFGAWNGLKDGHLWLQRFTIFALLVLPLSAHLRMLSRWDPARPGFNPDLLKYKTELRAAVPKQALCIVGNDVSHSIFFYYLDKKGWAFSEDQLDAAQLRDKIQEGASYLYSDSRKIEAPAPFNAQLDGMLAEYGSIRVWKLKKGPEK